MRPRVALGITVNAVSPGYPAASEAKKLTAFAVGRADAAGGDGRDGLVDGGRGLG